MGNFCFPLFRDGFERDARKSSRRINNQPLAWKMNSRFNSLDNYLLQRVPLNVGLFINIPNERHDPAFEVAVLYYLCLGCPFEALQTKRSSLFSLGTWTPPSCSHPVHFLVVCLQLAQILPTEENFLLCFRQFVSSSAEFMAVSESF